VASPIMTHTALTALVGRLAGGGGGGHGHLVLRPGPPRGV
jgi:hypothetical protein